MKSDIGMNKKRLREELRDKLPGARLHSRNVNLYFVRGQNFITIAARQKDTEPWVTNTIELDDVERLAYFIHALVARYNFIVNRINLETKNCTDLNII